MRQSGPQIQVLVRAAELHAAKVEVGARARDVAVDADARQRARVRQRARLKGAVPGAHRRRVVDVRLLGLVAVK